MRMKMKKSSANVFTLNSAKCSPHMRRIWRRKWIRSMRRKNSSADECNLHRRRRERRRWRRR